MQTTLAKTITVDDHIGETRRVREIGLIPYALVFRTYGLKTYGLKRRRPKRYCPFGHVRCGRLWGGRFRRGRIAKGAGA